MEKRASARESQNRVDSLELPNQPTKKFVSGLTSFLSGGTDSRCPGIQVPIGWKPSDSFFPKQAPADDVAPASCRLTRDHWLASGSVVPTARREANATFLHWRDSISGTHSFAFSKSRFIENGFAIKPRTPGSCNNSWARSSSAFPETSRSGGTMRGGSALW